MKIGIVAAGLLLGSLANAQAITCKAQLVHTVCGSGKVEISFDIKAQSFEFHNGDVPCWTSDYHVTGALEKSEPNSPFFQVDTFQLSALDETTGKMVSYGRLLYDGQLRVARLEGAHKYDLSCEQ